MKIVCEHCHQEITKEIINQFGHYRTGSVLCPHCHKNSNRYLSELDIVVYYSCSALLYAIGMLITMTLMNLFGTPLWVILVTLLVVALMMLIMIQLSASIYTKAWLKKEWKYHHFDEDQSKTAKHGKLEFCIIMFIVFVFATQKQLIMFYAAIILAIALVLFIQVILLYAKEKEIIDTKKSRK